MFLADKITLTRIFLSPLFFVFYMLPSFFPFLFPNGSAWTVPVLWFIYVGSEITDLIDGIIARKRNESSDFGKLFDPFADTLLQITCFLCFVLDGSFPLVISVLYLIVLYREFSILLLRNMMMKKGITMGARMGGKIKTVIYIFAGGAALVTISLQRLGIFGFLIPWFRTGFLVVFIIAVIFSLLSFFDYVSVYRRAV
jgi:CDP-diacylglycerol--glycerol-3-phosphate 3-phosphatidyltransferase